MEGLLFVSDTTKTVYFWNGKEVITVFSKDKKNRPLGKIMSGIPKKTLQFAHLFSSDGFFVGEAHYTIIIKQIDVDLENLPKCLNRTHIVPKNPENQ